MPTCRPIHTYMQTYTYVRVAWHNTIVWLYTIVTYLHGPSKISYFLKLPEKEIYLPVLRTTRPVPWTSLVCSVNRLGWYSKQARYIQRIPGKLVFPILRSSFQFASNIPVISQLELNLLPVILLSAGGLFPFRTGHIVSKSGASCNKIRCNLQQDSLHSVARYSLLSPEDKSPFKLSFRSARWKDAEGTVTESPFIVGTPMDRAFWAQSERMNGTGGLIEVSPHKLYWPVLLQGISMGQFICSDSYFPG